MNKRKISKAIKRLTNLPGGHYFFYYAFNKCKHFYLRSTKSTKVAYPNNIMLELTNACNLACTTCPRVYDYGKNMDIGFMKIDQAKGIIDELWPYLDSIGLTGLGETLLYKDIEEVVDYIKSKNKGIIVSLSTNAVIPDFAGKVARLVNKVDTIQISIDGLGEVYDTIRKNASFEKLDTNLRKMSALCKGSHTTLMMNLVVTKENYRQMADLVFYAESIGVKYLDFSCLNLASMTAENTEYYQLYRSEAFREAMDALNMAIQQNKQVVVNKPQFVAKDSFRNCPFPWSHYSICWNGFLVPCCAKPFPKELNFGNVFDGKVIDLLNSSDLRSWRTMWYDEKTPSFCTKCNVVHFHD